MAAVVLSDWFSDSNKNVRFAVRGAVDDRKVQFAKEGAFYQAVRWFGEYLG
jgi:hypothetical protein